MRRPVWPAAVPEQPPLGRWWFGDTADEDLTHRQGLIEAADRASRREGNFDQPWWAANVRALLEYVTALEDAVVRRATAAGMDRLKAEEEQG